MWVGQRARRCQLLLSTYPCDRPFITRTRTHTHTQTSYNPPLNSIATLPCTYLKSHNLLKKYSANTERNKNAHIFSCHIIAQWQRVELVKVCKTFILLSCSWNQTANRHRNSLWYGVGLCGEFISNGLLFILTYARGSSGGGSDGLV